MGSRLFGHTRGCGFRTDTPNMKCAMPSDVQAAAPVFAAVNRPDANLRPTTL